MNKKLRFLITMFIFSLALILAGGKNPVSAVTVGSLLTSPEAGWQRIDDTNSSFKYYGSWNYSGSDSLEVCGTFHYTNTVGSYFKFYFTGSKLRFISYTAQNYVTSDAIMDIDGKITEHFTTVYPNINCTHKVLCYESPDLDYGPHEVTVTCNDPKYLLENDAIDIYTADPEILTVDKSTLSLKSNAIETLKASLISRKYTAKDIVWSSSDNNTATVDENGNVIGIKKGTAKITASITGSNLKASCTVNVTGDDKVIDLKPIKYITNLNGTIDVKVVIKGNTGAESITFIYDNDKLKFMNADIMNGVKMVKSNNKSGILSINLINKNFLNSSTAENEAVTLHFKPKSQGKTNIKITGSDISNCSNHINSLADSQCGETDILIR